MQVSLLHTQCKCYGWSEEEILNKKVCIYVLNLNTRMHVELTYTNLFESWLSERAACLLFGQTKLKVDKQMIILSINLERVHLY
jgi:hypothetical protein